LAPGSRVENGGAEFIDVNMDEGDARLVRAGQWTGAFPQLLIP